MSLISLLQTSAIERGIIDPGTEIDAALAFTIVRDLPYQRASNRDPETTINEWRGTCSGKHYLLHKLFEELGLPSKIVACTSITPVEAGDIPPEMRSLYESSNRRFVDVHNYLLVSVPGGNEMVVDATWPRGTQGKGIVINEEFILGQDQVVSADVEESWVIPEDEDPQSFKDHLLKKYFTPAELEFREVVIEALSKKTLEAG